MPLYTWKSSGWLWFIHKACKGSKFPITSCLFLTRICTRRYTRGLSCRKLRNCCKFVTCLILQNIGFWWIAFPKGKLQNTQKLAFVTVIWCGTSLPGQHSFPRPRHPAAVRRVFLTNGRAAREAGASLSPPRCPGTSAAMADQCKARSSAFEVWPFSFEKLFQLKEMKQNKTRQKKQLTRSPKWHYANFRFGNWFICQLIGTHT